MTASIPTAPLGGVAAPARMRAAVPDERGGASVADVTTPRPVGAEVLVRVLAAGVGPHDLAPAEAGATAVPGLDFSGVVAEAPYEGFWLQPGDAVFGVSGFPRAGGSFAEYAAVPAGNLARKPAHLSHPEAAAVPTAALTAWGVVVDLVRAHEGQQVLVHAGVGGAGRLAVQLAAFFGARVTATASGADREWLRRLGAERVLDHDRDRFEDEVGDVDAVIDLVGDDPSATGPRSVGVLRPGGVLVTVPERGWPTLHAEAARAGVRATRFRVTPDSNTLAVLARLLDAGDLSISVAEVLPLERIGEAQRLAASGRARGPVALRMAG